MDMATIAALAPVIPVLTIERAADAVVRMIEPSAVGVDVA